MSAPLIPKNPTPEQLRVVLHKLQDLPPPSPPPLPNNTDKRPLWDLILKLLRKLGHEARPKRQREWDRRLHKFQDQYKQKTHDAEKNENQRRRDRERDRDKKRANDREKDRERDRKLDQEAKRKFENRYGPRP